MIQEDYTIGPCIEDLLEKENIQNSRREQRMKLLNREIKEIYDEFNYDLKTIN